MYDYELKKKIEYCIIKMIHEKLDIYYDDEYNNKFTRDKNLIKLELGIKINYNLDFNSIFEVFNESSNVYIFNVEININKISDKYNENLFVNRYKNYLHNNEIVLIYLCIDNENKYIYNDYKERIKNTIHNINV